MMGRQSRQMAMVFVDMASLIPENHLLRKIDGMVSFDFIYGLLAPYYSATGRPSVDPVSMFKMLLVGYLYGIKSERRLVEEIRLNIAYRWFCGFELDDAIPDHSTFSKTRTRKWQQSGLFQNAFYEIVKQCIACGLIDGKAMAADGSYIPANVSRESWVDVETEVEQSMQSYLDALDEELSQQPGFKKPPERTIKKRRTTSRTDPDSGYINHGNKRGIGYLMEATVDCKHGILTGVDVYPANEKESLLVLRHLEQQIKLGVPMNQLALDRGYDTGAVHRGLELLGVTGYIPAIQFPNAPEKYGFSYNPQRDAFICPEGVGLTYHRLNCNQSTGKYLRCYQIEDDACKHCVKRPSCFDKAGIRRRVLASSCYPAFFRGHQRVGTPEFLSMMRLRKIWAEGSFSVLKREHCISKIRKRGILAATEECLLAAMALNLKRMASAVFFYLHISYSAGTTAGFGSFLAFVNGSSEEHRLLTTLRDSQLKDNEARQTFYRKVIDSLDMGDSSYLLLLTCDSYDVPHRGKDDSLQADASDEVFTYIVCVVCPIKEGKVELGYFPGDNEFHCAAGQTVAPPELGFLFPAFDDRAANIYNALFYSRKANEIHQEFIDAIFHVEAPMSAVEQKEAFQSALSDAFDCSLEVMQTVHEQLREKIKEHRESRSSEPLEMSASEIGQILQSCGIADEQVAAFQENCGEQFGSGVVLNPANLIDSSRFEIKTPEITISADPEYSYLVETQIINGRKYLLIPTEDGVEVNGFAVGITVAQKDD